MKHSYSTEYHKCRRPNVVSLDHAKHWPITPIVNRACLTCGTHWYGDAEMAVFEMPKSVWEKWGSA